MKLFIERDPAPNPRRVGIFLREKGIDIPTERVDLRRREHKSPEHLARNSLGQVPVLELDDGRRLTESVSICRYLEALHPEPPLFGRDPYEQAFVDQQTRRIELQLMGPVGQFWRHAHPLTSHLLHQHREFGESNRKAVERAMGWLDRELAAAGPWMAGERFSMADIVAVTTLDFADLIGLPTPDACANLKSWRAGVEARPTVAMPEAARRRYETPRAAR